MILKDFIAWVSDKLNKLIRVFLDLIIQADDGVDALYNYRDD